MVDRRDVSGIYKVFQEVKGEPPKQGDVAAVQQK